MVEAFDLIVVGAGSAGCAMAGRLAESGKCSVLLLEAGGSNRDIRLKVPALTSQVVQNPAYDWCFETEPDPSVGGRTSIWPAGKCLGGGSSINGMMFIRAHPWDFANWHRMGATGWDYASVLPYYRRMERFEAGEDAWRGGSGPVAVSHVRARYPVTDAWIEAAQQAGVPRSPDLNGRQAEGVDYVQTNQHNGLRCSSADAYLGRHGGRLKVVTGRQVTRIELVDGRARRVHWRADDGSTGVYEGRAGVVVSAGAMASPKLLMLSGIGPQAHLRGHGIGVAVDLPGVGGNLQDHVGTHLVNDVNVRTLNSDARGLALAAQFARFALRRSGILTTPIGHAHAYVRTRADMPAPNIQLAFAAFAFDLDAQGRLVLRPNPAVSTLVALMRPSHRGTIRLRDADPLSAPVIDHRMIGSDEDVEELCDGFEIARRIMAQSPIAGHVTGEVRPGVELASREQLRSYVRAAAIPLYHPVGTCRIGDGEDAVVDSGLAVRGVERLWVADASVMPSLPSGNTNATSIMIGDKGAAHVLNALYGQPMLAPSAAAAAA